MRGSQQQSGRTRINHQIRVPRVRVIDSEGEQVGVMSTDQALREAQGSGMDLVEISPNADPPVCRIMDYGKYLFEQNKKKAQAKKNQKQTQVKEVKFRPGTDVGDFNVKVNKIKKFIEQSNKVKVTLRFRGREMQHKELGMELLQRVRDELGETVTVEHQPKLEGRQMSMVLAPVSRKGK